jgi:hypothetical protein
MPRPRQYDVDALAGKVYDLLAGLKPADACPHEVLGLTRWEISERLDLPAHWVGRAIRRQRLIFAGDEINIPIHRCGTDQVYHLSGEVAAGNDWMQRRLRNEVAQEQVNIAWWQSMAAANQHDEVRQRYCELILRDHQRLLEDLERLAS